MTKLTNEELLRKVIKAAVELAIMRHSLTDEDVEERDDFDMEFVTADTANAAFGVDTCVEEPIPEVAEILQRMAEGAAGEALCHACGAPARKAGRLGNNKLMLPHKCPHGKPRAAGDKNAGLHANHNHRCKECLSAGRAAGEAAPQGDLLAALKAIKGLFADGAPFYVAKIGNRITNGDQALIDSVFIALDKAIESGSASTAGPRPRCPKCSEPMEDIFRRVSQLSESAVKVRCLGPELSFHQFTITKFSQLSQFFAAAPAEDTKEEK